MKINLLIKSKALVLMALVFAIMYSNATAQQYDYKYVGKYSADNPAIPHWGMEVINISTDPNIICPMGWADCEALGPYWRCRNYINGNPNSQCAELIPGDNTSMYLNQLFGGGVSRNVYIYKAAEIGNTNYNMEITGIAIYSSGMYVTQEGDNAFKTGGVAWRQIPAATVTPAWPWADPSTTPMLETTIDKWPELDVSPKYKILSNTDWNMSSIPGTGAQGRHDGGWAEWIDIPLETPVVFHSDSNLELAFLQDRFVINNFGVQSNEISGWAYVDPDGDNVAIASTSRQFTSTTTPPANNITLCTITHSPGRPPFFPPSTTNSCQSSNMKPHLRLTYRYLSCENVKTWVDAPYYTPSDKITPENMDFSFEMQYHPADAVSHVYYTVIGPYPSTDTVYKTTTPIIVNQSNRGSDELGLFSASLADYPDITATGSAVGADGRTIDCSLLRPGNEYRVVVSVKTQIDVFEIMTASTNFLVLADHDLVARNIIEPKYLQQYSNEANVPIKVLAEVLNSNFAPPGNEFYVQASLYRVNYDPLTGSATRTSNVLATLPAKTTDNPDGVYHWTAAKDHNNQPLAPAEVFEVHEQQFGSGFDATALAVGYYDVEIRVWTGDASWDEEHSNDVYPRQTTHHIIRIQKAHDVTLAKEQILPAANATTYLGKTLYVQTGVRNDGLIDLSDRAGYYLDTKIYHYNAATGKGSLVWAPAPYVVRSGTDGEGYVNTPCINDETLAPIGWLVNDIGQYIVETQLMVASGNTNPPILSPVAGQISQRIFTVAPGLAGTYTISAYGGSYTTIKAAVDALYQYGVSGNVRFELLDPEYTERSWDATHNEFPALDFRSKIPGVYDVLTSDAGAVTTRTRTITFAPGGSLATQRGSIRINLESKSGYGMWFGAADSAVAHPVALLNDVPSFDKQAWYQSDGYITWDGGVNKSFRIALKAPEGADYSFNDPINYFRAPIYMSNARNITIANCIIEENENSLFPSEYFLLPGNSYNGSELKWNNNYESSETTTKSYSAGVVMRSIPPYQEQYSGNFYNFEILPCTNITLRGNDISSFSYGIVSIGLDYRNGVSEYVIDVIDTLRNLTIQDLSNTQKYIDCLKRAEYAGVPAGGSTVVRWFRESTPSISRGIRYYKHHAVRQANGIVSEFVQVLDSANGGVARIFNRDGLFENNLIHNIGRAGIFLGNDENTVIRGNMITGITGNLIDANGARVTDVDVAGILLGGNQRTHVTEGTQTNGYMVIGTEISKNEISNLTGSGSIYGIKLEQVPVTEQISSFNIKFPDRPERLKIYSNIIWGLSPRTTGTARYGINLSLAKKAALPGEPLAVADNMYFSTADASHFLDNILVANNTIVLGEDGYYDSEGDYFGLRLQRIKNTRVLNNAIELEDSTQNFASTNTNNFAAMVYYQGPKPSELNNLIDYNAYGYRVSTGSAVDAYCHALTNVAGGLIDVAHRGEYRTLGNWQNWIGTDLYSVVRNFSQDFQQSKEDYPKLRFRTNPVPSNSPLDKRGTYLKEAEVDIDGINRILTDQNLDIGAQYVNSTKLVYDAELLNISAPATYKSAIGPWSDAEYFMIDDKPIKVRVLIRNNGSSIIQNKRITLRVYEEPAAMNNTVAATHTTNYTTKYYNNERALYNEQYTFPNITPANTSLFWEGSQGVTLSTGQSVELEFQLNKNFNSYYYLNNYNVPIQFTAMAPNVTPRYLFVVSADSTADLDFSNNTSSKHARFYIKKSKNDMLVSAVNTYHTMMVPRTDATGNIVLAPNTAIENTDWVAGKLNLDTLQQGLSRLRLYQVDNEAQVFDYDVIDRHAWDYRNIDYTLYRTLYVTDELGKDENRWVANRYDNTLRLFREQWNAQNLVDFLAVSSPSSKKNLVMASENFVSDIHKSLLQTTSLWILNNKAQRDTFLYNDARRLAFLNDELHIASLRDSLNKALVRDYFRADVVYDSLSENGPYAWNGTEYHYEYLPVSPLYTKARTTGGEIVGEKWGFPPSPYKFNSKTGTITGASLNAGNAFEIKPTGWGWIASKTVEDAQPFGTVFRPIDNLLGSLTVGAVYDTTTSNPDISISNPQTGKAAALCVSTLKNNIVLLGFDWRHFANVEVILDNIMEYITKNGGDSDNGTNLPISFYGFEANPISNKVALTWNTTSGSVISNFEIERANVANNKIGDFKQLESLPAKDNTVNNFYSKTDENLTFGSTLAYRLKLIDATGNFTYTDNKIVNIETAQFYISDIAPNPVTSISEFTLNNNQEQSLHIAIYDLSGKEMLVLNSGVLPSGNYQFEINSKNLPQAVYTLTIRGKQQTINKQFTVIK